MRTAIRTGATRARRSVPSWANSLPTCLAAGLLVASCSAGGTGGAPDVGVELCFDPSPAVGETTCRIVMTDASGAPIRGAVLDVEGNMNHAGMVPVFADLEEAEAGAYESAFEFTMGGDWYVVLHGELPDGRTIERMFDVPAVPSGAPSTRGPACCEPIER